MTGVGKKAKPILFFETNPFEFIFLGILIGRGSFLFFSSDNNIAVSVLPSAPQP